MNDTPDPAPPPPVPRIPMGKLWTALAVPPVVSAIGISAAVQVISTYPGWLFIAGIVVTVVIIFMSIQFHQAVATRYRGNSLVFLTLAYIFGQFIICAALAFGGCVVLFSNGSF